MRTIWRDRDYDGGELVVGKVFPMDDLKSPRYISTDRHDLFNDGEAFERLKAQQQKSIAKGDLSRQLPEVGFLPC